MRVTPTKIISVLTDLVMIPLAWYAAYWLRFNLGEIPHPIMLEASYVFSIIFFVQAMSFWVFGLYRGLWQFTSIPDLIRIIKAVLTGVVISLLIIYFIPIVIPRSIMFLYAWFLVSLLAGSRIMFRWFKSSRHMFSQDSKRVLIVGAGSGGELLLREFAKSQERKYQPIVIVDNDETKRGSEILGLRVAGTFEDIPALVKKHAIDLVIIAIPSAKAETIRNIVMLCEEAKVPFSTIPPLNDLVAGRANIKALREISLEDLLGRDPVTLNWQQINQNLTGKKILVSGGGGSIGAELCRQIAFLSPSELIIVDNSEFNLYLIDQELSYKFPHLKLTTRLVDVTDEVAVTQTLAGTKPEIIFHAAAYKHVPLLENQIRAAIRNNIIGTANIAEQAVQNGVQTFVLISTDKAVNPTNIMGSTKRTAEMICQHYNSKSATHFIIVRFGNVLGSAGSVVPLFKRQLEQNQDITVTHPEITRYFMTIPEASQLILQATVIGQGGEIFVLDMGEPIKISFLAEQMIRLAGKKLGEDVKIIYTGLRPGEKMYEELFYGHEALSPTEHNKILKSQYKTNLNKNIDALLQQIKTSCETNDEGSLQKLLMALVPEYSKSKK